MKVLNFNFFAGSKTPGEIAGRDWSNENIAEFYRVEAALLQAGVPVETERGVTDEGDPWFVFCRVDNGDIIVHFARTGGLFMAALPSIAAVLKGNDFRALIVEFMQSHPVLLPATDQKGSQKTNVLLHPKALFTAFVATAFYLDGVFRVTDAQAKDGVETPGAAAGGAIQLAAQEAPIAIDDPGDSADRNRDAFSKIALLGAVVVALEISRDHFSLKLPQEWNLIANLLNGDEADAPKTEKVSRDGDSQQHYPGAEPEIQNTDFALKQNTPNEREVQHDQRSDTTVKAVRDAAEITEQEHSTKVESAVNLASQLASDVVELKGQSRPIELAHYSIDDDAVHRVTAEAEKHAAADGNQSFGHIDHSVFGKIVELANGANFSLTPTDSLSHNLISWIDHNVIDRAYGANTSAKNLTLFSNVPVLNTNAAPSEPGPVQNNDKPFSPMVFMKDQAPDARLIEAFVRSDKDVKAVLNEGRIVIYDQSDVQDNVGNLQVYTWAIGETQTVSLVGAADFFHSYFELPLAV